MKVEDRKEVIANFVTPFGPVFAKIEVDGEMFKLLKTECLRILKENKRSWGENLEGRIAREILFSNEELLKTGLYGPLLACGQAYVERCKDTQRVHIRNFSRNPEDIKNNKTPEVKIESAWINEMVEGEYNPAHFHTDCLMASVLFIQIPELLHESHISGKKTGNNTDGHLEFLYTSTSSTSLERGSLRVSPVPGDFYIFPSHLTHTVYPFQGEGTRISLAINFSIK